MSSDLWVGAVTTLAGAVLGGGISLALSRQVMKDARVQRAEEAMRQKYRRSVDRRFDAYSEFFTRARVYRNALNPYRKLSGPALAIDEIDALARSADAASSLVLLVVESAMTFTACRAVVEAIGSTQMSIYAVDPQSTDTPWLELNNKLAIVLREFQAAAREELEVGGIERSWIMSRDVAP